MPRSTKDNLSAAHFAAAAASIPRRSSFDVTVLDADAAGTFRARLAGARSSRRAARFRGRTLQCRNCCGLGRLEAACKRSTVRSNCAQGRRCASHITEVICASFSGKCVKYDNAHFATCSERAKWPRGKGSYYLCKMPRCLLLFSSVGSVSRYLQHGPEYGERFFFCGSAVLRFPAATSAASSFVFN